MKTQIGTFLSIGSPAIAELAAECGLDWVLIENLAAVRPPLRQTDLSGVARQLVPFGSG